MIVPTHILITALVAHATGLEEQDLILAYCFGAAVDLDHLYVAKELVSNKTISFKKIGFKHPYPITHSLFFIPFVLGATILFRSWVPSFFWLLHILFDFLQRAAMRPLWPFSNREFSIGILPHESKLEWTISLSGMLIFFILV